MVFPVIANPHATTLTTVGGLDWNKIQQYFSGVDVGAADVTNKPSINTETRFRNNKFMLFDSDGSNTLKFKTPSLAVDVNLSFPSTLSNAFDNEFVFVKAPQVLENKFIDSGVNSVTNLRNANLATDAALSWSKISKAGSLLSDISNLDITGRVNNSSIRWDATNNKWVMFTASTGLDVQLANLTDVILNTPATGQILQFNGTSWINAESAATSSISKGPYTFSGNGTQKVFQIPHNVTGASPNIGIALATSDDAIGAYKTAVDSTYITITYQNPPPAGTNNLSYYWLASDPFGTATGGIDVTKIVKFNQANTYGLFDQVFPSGNFKLTNSGFKAGFNIGTLTSDLTYTFPSSSQNLVGRTSTDTMLNKTLVSPIFSTIENSGTLTLPTGPTNIQGHNTPATLTSKTINGPDNTITNLVNSNLSNSANIDWNKINKTGSLLGDLGNVTITSPATNQLLQYNGTAWVNSTISAVGETNTGSNVNIGGVGVFKQKTGVNFEFRGINAVDNKVSVSLDATNNEVDIGIVPANITLSSLAGSLVWTQVSKTGSLLSDFGGTVSSSQLPADIITTSKILDANVTLGKLATGSVDSSKIVDGSIVNADINTAAAIAWSKISKATSALADIANVVLTSPVSGHVLTYNGTNWVNQTPTGGSSNDNPVTGIKSGKVIPGGATGTNIGSGMCNGWQTDALTSGNVSLDSDADGDYFSLNTTSTSQTNAEINSNSAKLFRGDLNCKVWTKIKFPNVNNNRWFIGFTDTIALAENTFNFLNSKSGFGLRYDTSNSGETTWKLITNNGASSQTVLDTGITPVNNTVYNIGFSYNFASSNVTVNINGTILTQPTAIPASSTKMGWLQRMQTTTGSVRNQFVYYIYTEQDK